ncbi:putative glycosyltransferase 6 domain-containing protein 1 [Equus quagga]|uniref:putative glycosyltransferase 6 domain-containing protein 1 n=1 Tax=Equus quagga TaxID=89248 RepID=UPI001EE35F6B|nr:putative glycosyltransferase 6 domain-containing protein 1 [Equus quagga]
MPEASSLRCGEGVELRELHTAPPQLIRSLPEGVPAAAALDPRGDSFPFTLRNQGEELQLSEWFRPRRRPDVITTTDWLAPVIWEGTFNRRVLGKHYRNRNLTMGLAVFAISRIADQYLERFLESAKKHFMTGYRVVFYITVDDLDKMPDVDPGPLQTFQVFTLQEEIWWQDFDLLRMRNLGEHIVQHIQGEVDFLFSMATNQIFQSDVGVETLGASVAQLHAWWYFKSTKDFPYERRRRSAAYIPYGKGDFYYDSAFVGGTPQQVLNLIEEYLKGVLQDKQNGLNSSYENHLNKYFFLNKPTKLLSPEYNWDVTFYPPPQVQFVKVAQHPKRRPWP